MRKIRFGAAVFALILLMTGCSGNGEDPKTKSTNDVSVTKTEEADQSDDPQDSDHDDTPDVDHSDNTDVTRDTDSIYIDNDNDVDNDNDHDNPNEEISTKATVDPVSKTERAGVLQDFLQAVIDEDEEKAIAMLKPIGPSPRNLFEALTPMNDPILNAAMDPETVTVEVHEVEEPVPFETFAVVFYGEDTSESIGGGFAADEVVTEDGFITYGIRGAYMEIPYQAEIFFNGVAIHPEIKEYQERNARHKLHIPEIFAGDYTITYGDTYLRYDQPIDVRLQAYSDGYFMNASSGVDGAEYPQLRTELEGRLIDDVNDVMARLVEAFNEGTIDETTLADDELTPEVKGLWLKEFLEQNGMKTALMAGRREFMPMTLENQTRFTPYTPELLDVADAYSVYSVDEPGFIVSYQFTLRVDGQFELTNKITLGYRYLGEDALELEHVEITPKSP